MHLSTFHQNEIPRNKICLKISGLPKDRPSNSKDLTHNMTSFLFILCNSEECMSHRETGMISDKEVSEILSHHSLKLTFI